MTLQIGTSGWQYRDWRGRFYPERLAQRDWLRHYAARFDVVEVNNTFYRLPKREAFAAWREASPARFRFALKLSRYLSHVRRLRDPEEPVERFLERATGLGDRRGPLLLQLPPSMPIDLDRLGATLDRLRGRARVAVEVRHTSWHVAGLDTLLREHDAALCLTDRGERPLEPLRRTASWGYVRLHEGRGPEPPGYTPAGLRHWVGRIADLFGGDDVYVFFNNDPGGAAIRDAVAFAELARKAGMACSQVPAAGGPTAGAKHR